VAQAVRPAEPRVVSAFLLTRAANCARRQLRRPGHASPSRPRKKNGIAIVQ